MTKRLSCCRRPVIVLSAIAAVLISTFVLSFAQSKNKTLPDAGYHHHDYAELAKVPKKSRARRNPFEDDPDAVDAGRKLFLHYCAECHGETAEGGRKAPSLRAPEVQNATPGTVFWILTNGVVRRGMPVWSRLPEPQRWQIVTFVKSLPSPAITEPDITHSQMH